MKERARFVGQRPRQIEVEAAAKTDPRWFAANTAISAFLEKVRCGADLTPRLSLSPHTRGYSLAAHTPGATNADRWSDKDVLLTRMNLHHFHLGRNINAAGHAARTDNLMFAKVGRDWFRVISIFDHRVFKPGSAERCRLAAAHNEIIYRSLPPGAGVMSGAMMPSGHALHVFTYAQYCTRLLESVDPELDDRAYIEKWFEHEQLTVPAQPNFAWSLSHLDLVVSERSSGTQFLLQQGWN